MSPVSRRNAPVFAGVFVVLGVGGFLARKNQVEGPSAPRAGAKPWAKRVELAGCENAALIAPGIYRGAQPTEKGLKTLKALGVKTVVSLRLLHDEAAAVKKAGLEALAIPIMADVRGSEPPDRKQIDLFLGTLLDPAKQPIYFHCAFGKDRTGTMCALYRVEVEGWPNQDAFDEMQHFGFNDVWEDLERFVKTYAPSGKFARR